MDLKTSTQFSTQFWTPDGPREEVPVPPEYLKMIAVLAETSGRMQLGLHCSRCGQDLVGKNAPSDRRWMMECACRTFIGANPLPRAGTT
jgi:hypothetical protein